MAEEKKIFVDEDWKSQVEAEKAAYASQASSPPPGNTGELPPASFEMLVTTFATEAMVALGQLPNPFTNEHSVNWDHAKYTIDMLQVIAEKTKGNLSQEEDTMLEGLLHQLRMAFVTLRSNTGTSQGPADSSRR